MKRARLTTSEQDAIAWAVAEHTKARPPVFPRPTKAHTCGRVLAAGPGSCARWWEGCPKPEKAGCFRVWAKSDPVVDWWRGRLPEDWTPAPMDLANLTAKRLLDLREAEVREVEGERWQWRRTPSRTPCAQADAVAAEARKMARRWSENDIRLIRAIAETGGSMSDAARQLATTRSAIAGKAHREGISFQGFGRNGSYKAPEDRA